ncbi:MAG: sigma-70 family RNA polymerase sigma factor [Burkholderiaceae bacterium]|nr:sigma-70 family RNA polymerase sigma factor [Burkholderiaceae bacterium]
MTATAYHSMPTPHELASHRDVMLRFARRRIRDECLAEDAVQEALAAALAARDRFRGTAAPRTWLIGILNHKIQDTFRREGRYVGDLTEAAASNVGSTSPCGFVDREIEDPMAQVSRARLGAALALEVDALPVTLKDVFMLHVVEGAGTGEVCERLGISEANCWVRLHRARKRLAARLDAHLA